MHRDLCDLRSQILIPIFSKERILSLILMWTKEKKGVPVVSWLVKGKIQESSTLPTVYSKQPHTGFIMHLSAAIPGVDPGEPRGICTKTFANSTYPGPILFHKKLPLSLPRGA